MNLQPIQGMVMHYSDKRISSIKKKLKSIIGKEPNTIRYEVAKHALEYDNPIIFFNDLLRYGCVNGMISSLIYYKDTHAFFEKYYDQIETLRLEFESSPGESLSIKGDLKNQFAWFGFEETAYRMAEELGIGI